MLTRVQYHMVRTPTAATVPMALIDFRDRDVPIVKFTLDAQIAEALDI